MSLADLLAEPDPIARNRVAELDELVDGIFDDPEASCHGWRYFVFTPDGKLWPPFGFGGGVSIPRGWARAECGQKVVPGRIRPGGYDIDAQPHEVPGDRCGCGWRVYPSLAIATAAAAALPGDKAAAFSRSELVLAGVEYGGAIATRPIGPRRAMDEPGTLRAEWIQVVGPLYVSGRAAGRPVRRALCQRYGLRAADVVKVETGVFDAVAAGGLAD